MKRLFAIWIMLMLMTFVSGAVFAQEKLTIVAPTSEAAKGLDLRAVSELFKDSENLKTFEKNLNDPETGVNNLDLDGNGEVDFIRVVEKSAEGARVIILQAALGNNDFQDVATIEVEKSGGEQYNMQVHGNEVIYGANYYVAPVQVRIHTWPIIRWIYRPNYRPYRSVFYFGYYPRWWKPYRPVKVTVYRTRTNRYRGRTTFTVTRTRRVHAVTKVKYKPRTSTRVVRKTKVTHTNKATGRTTTVTKKSVKTTNKKTGRTTVVKKKKTTTTRKGKKTTVVKRKKTTKKRR